MRPTASATTRVPILEPSTTMQEASAAMLDAGVETAVVVDGRSIRGVLTAGDVADALAQGRDAHSTPVEIVAHPDPMLVEAREPLAEARQRMRSAGSSLAVVVDGRRAVGVIADDGTAV